MLNITHLLLAAGFSKRMGKPKQLLTWGNKTLIEHQIKTLLKTGQEIVVVLGAHADKGLPLVNNFPVSVCINNNWPEGMGSSISFGIKKVRKKFPDTCGVLISLIDQPLVTNLHFQQMLDIFESGNKQIIVSNSENRWSGAPVLFDKFYFKELQELNGDKGAKLIVRKYRNSVKLVDGGDILKDIDTHEDYLKLLDIYKSML